MQIPRIFVDTDLSVGAELDLSAGPARHIGQVLRLGTGDQLVLFNGDGYDYPARLIAASRQTMRVLIASQGDPEPPQPLAIHLALGVSRGERMDFALQKAVELGVTRLTPLFTKRSQVKLEGARLEKRMEHWRGIVVAACEQSGRGRLPTLEQALGLTAWLEQSPVGGLLLDPLAPLALTSLPPPDGAITLLVGPEGGLSSTEREEARHQGFQGVRLGPRVLRTETAPLAAIAVAQALWGDFREDA